MLWYQFIAAFFGGAFLANVVPHLVSGMMGEPFPTPFANPPGRGLSSPTVNVLWALFNLVAGYLCTIHSGITRDNIPALLLFFAGVAVLSIVCSYRFQQKHPKP